MRRGYEKIKRRKLPTTGEQIFRIGYVTVEKGNSKIKPISKKIDSICLALFAIVNDQRTECTGPKRSFQKMRGGEPLGCAYMRHTGGGASWYLEVMLSIRAENAHVSI